MCSICSTVLKVQQHSTLDCPIRSALFCSICQDFGHATLKCPERDTWHYRKPEFIEQLIPSSILSHYKITSLTKITSGVKEHPPYIHGDPVIDVPEDDDGKNIRATLASYNLPCSSVKENKRVLEAYGNLIGKKIDYEEPTVKRTLLTKKPKNVKSS